MKCAIPYVPYVALIVFITCKDFHWQTFWFRRAIIPSCGASNKRAIYR